MKSFFSGILILTLGIFTNFVKVEKNDFLNECHKGYNSYVVELQEEKSSYDLYVIIGEYDSVVSYSILFNPSDVKEYELVIKELNFNKQYKIETNGYGGCTIYNLVSNRDLKIEITNHDIVTYSYELNYMSKEDYYTMYNGKLIYGDNLGMEVYKLNSTTRLTTILSIIFCGVILLSIIIILITYIFKKGKFNEETRNIEFEEHHRFRDEINQYIKEEDVIEVESEVIQEQEKPDYQYRDYYEERDISEILRNKGFNTNYSALTMDEKNLIMLELMKMRDLKEISDEEYRSETIKLWM